MTTENHPHVVYCEAAPLRASVCPNYTAAYGVWTMMHTIGDPWLIAVLGRVIDPATPIIDVNE
jgi:hypothetical protein